MKKLSWKGWTAIAAVVLVLAASLFVWQKSWIFGLSSIPAAGGTSSGAFHFAVSPIYLQTDPRWAANTIGGSGETIRQVGCTICCVSMALAQHGIVLPPNELNDRLKAGGGYTERGLVIWGAVSAVTNRSIRVDAPGKPSFARIDGALQAGQPVLAKVLVHVWVPHWVLIVGKDGQEYLIKDPLGDGKSLEKLSKLKSRIYAIRIVKKTA